MKFKVNRQELSEACSVVSRAVSLKSALPALEGILIKAQDNKLRLTGYDLELGIETEIAAQVEKMGEFIITARMFCDILRRLSGNEVDIEVDEKFLTTIKCGFAEYKLMAMSAEEFPEFPVIPMIKDFHQLKISQSTLKSMIEQTLFAVSQNDSKPIHTGSLFEATSDGSFNIVSLDGFRLALRHERVSHSEDFRFVVPGKALGEISKILKDEQEDALLQVTKRNLAVSIGNYKIYTRLLEGDFLDYMGAIPKNPTVKIKVNVRSFIDSCERTGLLISDRLKSPLRIKFRKNEINISCSTSLGKATDSFSAQFLEGDELEMGFNNRYLLDALKNTGSDEIILEISGSLSPMKVMPTKGDSFLFLVLPVRLKAE